MTMFCATQIGQVMLSLPRANYLTSAAAGLPLMLVRLPHDTKSDSASRPQCMLVSHLDRLSGTTLWLPICVQPTACG